MRLSEEVKKQAREKLGALTVFTLAQMMEVLSCSRRTAQRILKEWGCVTSYNANAAYYALPEVARFDSDGIWRHGPARFSIFGNLSETVIGLIQRAPEGMSADELSQVLGVRMGSFVKALVESGKLFREKIGHRYVYFSMDDQVRAAQTRKRQEMHWATRGLSQMDAISVLVEFIKDPTLGPAQLAERLRPRIPTVSEGAIVYFFEKHGIDFKSKKKRFVRSHKASSPSCRSCCSSGAGP
ncbi:MAG: hypothetical protein D6820_00500 [Lentisphaerae bacterium]|nr:MAG: hypothetical protein D6820_00500 [Lentisphaerota bacterium]